MFDHIQQPYIEAELAYRHERLQRSFDGSHRPHHSRIQRLRGAFRNHRNPVRGASRYELDGPLTRRTTTLEHYRAIAAPHH
jgi:hypothetical protein